MTAARQAAAADGARAALLFVLHCGRPVPRLSGDVGLTKELPVDAGKPIPRLAAVVGEGQNAEASGSGRKASIIARPTAGRCARVRPPTVRRLTHRPSPVARVVRFHEPTPPLFRRGSARAVRPSWPATRRPRRPVPQPAMSELLEEVLALERSYHHSRPTDAAQQAAAPDVLRAADGERYTDLKSNC